MAQNPLTLTSVHDKIKISEDAVGAALHGENFLIPSAPGRDVTVLPVKQLPPKPGLSKKEGQARLLHDLASIELQALELAFRTLVEYPEAPKEFRQELADLAVDEMRHLKMCVSQLENLGFSWGHWPVHLGLWQCVASEDSLLDRILIVHRYLEGSGLDAGATILKRLSGVADKSVERLIRIIHNEEIKHVLFGSHWYKNICIEHHLEADSDFETRLRKLFQRIPRRLEPLQKELRLQCGFNEYELNALVRVQELLNN